MMLLAVSLPVSAAGKKSFSAGGIIYEHIGTDGLNVRVIGFDAEAVEDNGENEAVDAEAEDEKTVDSGNAYVPGRQLVIPAQVTYGETEYNVTEIGNAAFAFSDLETIEISDGIASIGASAFTGSGELKSVIIPKSITKIGDGVFSYCPMLGDIDISEDNQDFVFIGGILYSKDKKQVYRITDTAGDTADIAKGAAKIRPYACEGNSAVKTVILPEKLKKICQGAFMDCDSLKQIEIPASVTKIEGNPFMYCDKLEKISVSSSNKQFYTSSEGLLLNKKQTLLISASAAKGRVVIPSGIKRIAAGAATGNTSITAVELSSSVYAIDAYAFADCTALKEVRFATRNVKLNGVSEDISGSTAGNGSIFKNTDYFINFKIPYSSDFNTEGSLEEMIRRNSPKGVMITLR